MAKSSKPLTAAAVSRYRAPAKGCREIPDGGSGLYLQLFASGRKSWALRYRRPTSGRPAKLTLGSVYDPEDGVELAAKPVVGAPLTLAAARRLVAEFKHEIRLGRDVGAEHIAAKRDLLTSDKFAGSALDFIEQHAKRKTRRWRDTARLLGFAPQEGDVLEIIKGGLADRWREKPVEEIDDGMIFELIEQTREKGVPGLAVNKKGPSEARARSMYSALSGMFNWLVDKRRLKVNPCSAVSRPEAPMKRERVLIDAEVTVFWDACNEVRDPFRPLLRVLLLTGCRLNEVAGMRRTEFSDDGNLWTIPSSRTKNHLPLVVALSPLALDVLKEVRSHPDSDLVFSTTGRTPVSGWSKLKGRLDGAMIAIARRNTQKAGGDPEKVAIAAWRLHDLRRTVVTGMNNIGVMPHIVEACVNHVSGTKGGVAGIYNHAAYLDEKRVAWQRWAAHVGGLLAGRPANVTSIRRGA